MFLLFLSHLIWFDGNKKRKLIDVKGRIFVSLKADLHGTVLSHARAPYDTLREFLGHDCRKVLKHVL